MNTNVVQFGQEKENVNGSERKKSDSKKYIFRNPTYMGAWCKASCQKARVLFYSFLYCLFKFSVNQITILMMVLIYLKHYFINIITECANRHPNCGAWATQGECQRNQFWMVNFWRRNILNFYIQLDRKLSSIMWTVPSQPRHSLQWRHRKPK
jgi:hypothetical protein